MLKEFVEKIEALAAAQVLTIHGLDYVHGKAELVVPPVDVKTLETKSLAGLVQAIQAKLDVLEPSEWIIHVRDRKRVELVQRLCDAYGRRPMLVSVDLTEAETFPFGRFLDREEFVIGLLSRFVPDAALDEVVKLASTLTAERVEIAEDDGISQRTTVKRGVTLKDKVVVRGRVVVRPYRTFREVEQPRSEFVFRLRSDDGEVPSCALFEADGGHDDQGLAGGAAAGHSGGAVNEAGGRFDNARRCSGRCGGHGRKPRDRPGTISPPSAC